MEPSIVAKPRRFRGEWTPSISEDALEIFAGALDQAADVEVVDCGLTWDDRGEALKSVQLVKKDLIRGGYFADERLIRTHTWADEDGEGYRAGVSLRR